MPGHPHTVPPRDATIAELTERSLAGDASAWAELVRRLERVVWKAVNMMTTDPDVRTDAFAATWLRLVERLDTIREPEKLPGWLTTTATNEVRQILRHRSRQAVRVDWQDPEDGLASALDATRAAAADHDHGRGIAREELSAAVRRAFQALDEECRQIIAILVLTDPAPSYAEASELLGRPVGSLGPSRRRCLDKLRTNGAIHRWATAG